MKQLLSLKYADAMTTLSITQIKNHATISMFSNNTAITFMAKMEEIKLIADQINDHFSGKKIVSFAAIKEANKDGQ